MFKLRIINFFVSSRCLRVVIVDLYGLLKAGLPSKQLPNLQSISSERLVTIQFSPEDEQIQKFSPTYS